jgi:hypothetical protein
VPALVSKELGRINTKSRSMFDSCYIRIITQSCARHSAAFLLAKLPHHRAASSLSHPTIDLPDDPVKTIKWHRSGKEMLRFPFCESTENLEAIYLHHNLERGMRVFRFSYEIYEKALYSQRNTKGSK